MSKHRESDNHTAADETKRKCHSLASARNEIQESDDVTDIIYTFY